MSRALMPFMRAHGQEPAPGQRPGAAGALAGALAGVAALPLVVWTGALVSMASALGVSRTAVALLYLALTTASGALYGALFRRAASDRRGGWLFGISYGFLLWMVGPITLLQTLLGRPLAVGTAAMGVLGAHLLSGVLLGLLFRPMHGLVQVSTRKRAAQTAHPGQTGPVGFPHAGRAPR